MIGVTGKGVKVDWKKGREGFGQDPPKGLEPMGDGGWYRTPDEPADPTDCDRYPDSPWCGGMPFTRKPIGLDVQPTVSECGVAVTVKPTLGFTKLPPASVAWIAPHCRDKYRKVEDVKAPPPASRNYSPPETNWPGGLDDDDEIIAVLGKQEILGNTFYKSYYKRLIYPLVERVDREGFWSHYSPPGGRSGTSIAAVEGGRTVVSADSSGSFPSGDTSGFNTWHLLAEDEAWKYGEDWNFLISSYSLVIVRGRFGSIKSARAKQDGTINFAPRTFVGGLWYAWWEVFEVIPIKLAPNGPPPGFDYGKRKCCMQCCSPNPFQAHREQQDNAEILALLRRIDRKLGNFPFEVTLYDADENKKGAHSKKISVKDCAEGLRTEIERTEKVSKMIGIDMFPLNLPKTIIEKAENNPIAEALDWINPFKNEKIDNLAEFNMWFFLQMSGILGHWQQQVKVITPKLDKAGNPVKDKDGKPVEKDEYVILPDISQTLKELFVINTQSLKLQGLAYDTLIKACIDLVGTKVLAAEAAKRAEDIQQYLDYETDEKELDVPIQFKFPRQDAPDDEKNDVKRFLTPSTAKVIYDDWDAKGHKSLNESLTEIEVAARIIHALFYQGNQ